MFAPVVFSPSLSVGVLAEGLAASLEGLKKGFADGAAALGGLGLPASGPGDLAGLMAKTRETATKAVGSAAKFLPITPFQYGVGTRKGEHGFLTPAQGLAALVSRFADADLEPTESAAVAALSDATGFDPALPVEHASRAWERINAGEGTEERGLVALLVASPTHAMLGQALEAFNKVYPIPQLEQVCRRAKALATLETDKFVIPKAPGFPAWGQAAPQRDPKGQAVAKALGGMLAAGEGAAMGDAAPGDMLAAFAQKQASKLAQKAADLSALAASMSGGFDSWAGFSVQATGPALFRYLSELTLPFDESCKCSSLLCWCGKPDEVAFYRESFGLCRRTLTNPACMACPGENPACPF